MMAKDYRVEIRVKNGPLHRAMQEEGYATAAELSRASGVNYSTLMMYLNLMRAPVGRRGWNGAVLKLAEFLRRLPEDLFPQQHIDRALGRNVAIVDMDIIDVAGLIDDKDPERLMIAEQAQDALDAALATITSSEERIIRLRFGIGSGSAQTLEQIADEFGVTRERIRRIEERALRKLRHPSRRLRDVAEALCA